MSISNIFYQSLCQYELKTQLLIEAYFEDNEAMLESFEFLGFTKDGMNFKCWIIDSSGDEGYVDVKLSWDCHDNPQLCREQGKEKQWYVEG